MTQVGHLITIEVVFTTMPINLMIAMDLPKWMIKSIDKW